MYVVRQPYKGKGDNRYYVQHISYLDYGRFEKEEAAIELKKYLEELDGESETSP